MCFLFLASQPSDLRRQKQWRQEIKDSVRGDARGMCYSLNEVHMLSLKQVTLFTERERDIINCRCTGDRIVLVLCVTAMRFCSSLVHFVSLHLSLCLCSCVSYWKKLQLSWIERQERISPVQGTKVTKIKVASDEWWNKCDLFDTDKRDTRDGTSIISWS